MATHTQILSPQGSSRGSFAADRRTGFFRRFFAPVVLQKPMTEKDIKQYLYPAAPVNIECRVVHVEEKG